MVEAITYPDHDKISSLLPTLTPKERLVVRELGENGDSDQEIANELVMATQTVKNHLQSIYSKLELDDIQIPRVVVAVSYIKAKRDAEFRREINRELTLDEIFSPEG